MFILLTIYGVLAAIFVGILFVGLYQKNINVLCDSKRRLDGKTAIVTGGTSGIGLEIAKDLAHRGARVIVACPFEEEGTNGRDLIIRSSGNRNVIFDLLDLSSFTSIKKFAANILKREQQLDILMNNSGVSAGSLSEDGLNYVMQVNFIGQVLLTFLLLPLLKSSGTLDDPSRIANLVSLTHKFGKLNLKGWRKSEMPLRNYANSKLCFALFTRALAKRLKDSTVVVNAVDPGIVGTRIFKYAWNNLFGTVVVFLTKLCSKTAFEGAQTAIHVAVCDKALKKNGKYFCNCKLTRNYPSTTFYNDEIGQFLWDKTVELLKNEADSDLVVP